MALDTEQEALWYLSGQRIIHALGERLTGAFRLTEYAIPAGTFTYPHLHKKENEAQYVIEGEADLREVDLSKADLDNVNLSMVSW
jgi:uncharacterized cupin superfamily protein